jgi:hypothetical protein
VLAYRRTIDEGHPVDFDDLATITPYMTRTIRRFGDWVLNLAPPDVVPVTAWIWSPSTVPNWAGLTGSRLVGCPCGPISGSL